VLKGTQVQPGPLQEQQRFSRDNANNMNARKRKKKSLKKLIELECASLSALQKDILSCSRNSENEQSLHGTQTKKKKKMHSSSTDTLFKEQDAIPLSTQQAGADVPGVPENSVWLKTFPALVFLSQSTESITHTLRRVVMSGLYLVSCAPQREFCLLYRAHGTELIVASPDRAVFK